MQLATRALSAHKSQQISQKSSNEDDIQVASGSATPTMGAEGADSGTSTITTDLVLETSEGDLQQQEENMYSLLREKIVLRDTIIHNSYYLKYWFEYLAYCWIATFVLPCVLITSIVCVYFDTDSTVFLEAENGYQSDVDSSQCIDSSLLISDMINGHVTDIDIEEETRINYNETQYYIANVLVNGDNDWYSEEVSETNNFGTDYTTSERFLLDLLLSHLLSIFVYSPLISFFYSVLYKLHKFHRHPNKMTEGKFFSENRGFDNISSPPA